MSNLEEILNLAPVALLSFGAVWVVDFLLRRFTRLELETLEKLILQGVFAFLLLNAPAELVNLVAGNIKEAIGIVLGTTALYKVWQSR